MLHSITLNPIVTSFVVALPFPLFIMEDEIKIDAFLLNHDYDEQIVDEVDEEYDEDIYGQFGKED